MDQQSSRTRRAAPLRIAALAAVAGSTSSNARFWPLLMPVFLAGAVTTAYGLTLGESDLIVFAGMVLTGIGVVSMWLPGKGIRRSTLLVITAFVSGSICTGLSLTLLPGNDLFFAGMVLSGIGIIGMWMVGKAGRLMQVTAGTFIAGITTQAVGLTAVPSDPLVMAGMIMVSLGVFGMWVYNNR